MFGDDAAVQLVSEFLEGLLRQAVEVRRARINDSERGRSGSLLY
jgi:hypothetical protein